MADGYTIQIYVPDGDPDGVRVISDMNWTGLGVVFTRSNLPELGPPADLKRIGVYILVGYQDDDDEDDLRTLYIGQADNVRDRIETHRKLRKFWDWGIAFVSKGDELQRAYVTWLEYALLRRARNANRCKLDNGTAPQEPTLSVSDKNAAEVFLKRIFQILPLVDLKAFEFPTKEVVTPPPAQKAVEPVQPKGELDTIVIPAQLEGFKEVFLGEDCWYPVRIAGGRLDQIKYIAGYQIKPVQAITHYARVASFEPYGENGKWKLIFSEKAKEIVPPIPLGPDAPRGLLKARFYTSFAKLKSAKKVMDLLKP
ncbi:MAG TPA: GIY-YIG nuclease family protein [Rhizomicrobium sp.]